MLRRLLTLLLVACLLAGGWMPCCAGAALAAPQTGENAAQDCHGDAGSDADPAPADGGPGSLCDDCEHCLSRLSLVVDASVPGGVAPAALPLLRGADAAPSAPRAPPLRPPIARSDLA